MQLSKVKVNEHLNGKSVVAIQSMSCHGIIVSRTLATAHNGKILMTFIHLDERVHTIPVNSVIVTVVIVENEEEGNRDKPAVK